MRSQLITPGARFVPEPAYTVEEVHVGPTTVQALVRFDTDGGTDIRVWGLGTEVPLTPAP